MRLVILALFTVTVAAQSPRPWMEGTIEKACGTPEHIAKVRKAKPNARIEECHCRHACDPMNEHTDETDGRAWDGTCAAKCSASNCGCPHPCDS